MLLTDFVVAEYHTMKENNLRLLVICFLQLLWLTAVVEEVEEHWNDCEEESDHFHPAVTMGCAAAAAGGGGGLTDIHREDI